jgi:uncharacterized protein YxjI
MRYLLRQKLWSIGDDFTIRDETGRDAFYVDGKVWTLRETLLLQDMQRNELARIQKKLLSLGPTYEIYRAGQLAAVVRKHLFTLLHTKFTVDVPGPDDLEAAGNFTGHEYAFTRAGRTVATVSKRWFTLTDTYGVDVATGEDDVLILAAAVVIDMCMSPDQKGHGD